MTCAESGSVLSDGNGVPPTNASALLYDYGDDEIREMGERVRTICQDANRLPVTSLMHYTMQAKATLLRNQRIEVRESPHLTQASRSVLTLIYDAGMPHIIWLPPAREITPVARRFFVCHELGHILFDDEKRLRYSEADEFLETPDENRRANLFAMMTVFSRGHVIKRSSTRTAEVLALNLYLSKTIAPETAMRTYTILQELGLVPRNAEA